MISGAAAAVRRANDAGWKVVVVSNQSGVARGLFPESVLPEIHREISATLLAEAGAVIDAFYYCPHHPTEGVGAYRVECDCRKPWPGMLLKASIELGIDPSKSWMVGDRVTDLQAGAAAGCRTILVCTGYGAGTGIAGPDANLKLVAVVPSVVEAVGFALLNSPPPAR